MSKNELSQRITEKITEIKEEIKEKKYSKERHLFYQLLIFQFVYLYEFVGKIEDEIYRESFIKKVFNYRNEMSEEILLFCEESNKKYQKDNGWRLSLFGFKSCELYPLFNHEIKHFVEIYKHKGETNVYKKKTTNVVENTLDGWSGYVLDWVRESSRNFHSIVIEN